MQPSRVLLALLCALGMIGAGCSGDDVPKDNANLANEAPPAPPPPGPGAAGQ